MIRTQESRGEPVSSKLSLKKPSWALGLSCHSHGPRSPAVKIDSGRRRRFVIVSSTTDPSLTKGHLPSSKSGLNHGVGRTMPSCELRLSMRQAVLQLASDRKVVT